MIDVLTRINEELTRLKLEDRFCTDILLGKKERKELAEQGTGFSGENEKPSQGKTVRVYTINIIAVDEESYLKGVEII